MALGVSWVVTLSYLIEFLNVSTTGLLLPLHNIPHDSGDFTVALYMSEVYPLNKESITTDSLGTNYTEFPLKKQNSNSLKVRI